MIGPSAILGQLEDTRDLSLLNLALVFCITIILLQY